MKEKEFEKFLKKRIEKAMHRSGFDRKTGSSYTETIICAECGLPGCSFDGGEKAYCEDCDLFFKVQQCQTCCEHKNIDEFWESDCGGFMDHCPDCMEEKMNLD